MSTIAPELVTIAFFVAVGWVGLWPLRGRLGAPAYHLAALPTGLLSAPLAGGVSTMTGRPLDALSAGAGGLVLIVFLWVVQRIVFGERGADTAPVGLRSFAAATGVLGVTAFVLGLARYTVSNNDSFMAYWPLGIELSRKGAYTASLMGTRSPLLPAMNAIHATFGSDWAYVIYPMLGATLLLWLVVTLRSGPAAGLRPRSAWLVAAGAAGFLVLEPSFLFHCFFVHSHMVSAVYLTMSLTCLWAAVPAERCEGDAPRGAYLILAGAFASGLALTRVDGLAYLFVTVAVAISVLTLSKVRWRSVFAFFAPLLLITLGTYGVAYLTLGVWASSKLSGRTALAILGVLVLSATGPWIVQMLDRYLPFRVAGERFLGILTAVAGVVMIAILGLKWETARGALATAGINLFEGAGGYSYLWYGVVAVLALSLLSRDALRPGSWTRSPFLSVALFFIIATLVHGTSHEGRIGVGDSFNRVAFHALPIVVWYVGAVVARIVGRAQPRSSARIQSHSD